MRDDACSRLAQSRSCPSASIAVLRAQLCITNVMGETAEKSSEKRVFLVRHGEGQHNVTKNYNLSDPVLTEKGQQQATSLRGHSDLNGCDLILVSPMTRTIQTATLAFGEQPPCPVMLCSLHQEKIGEHCDVGRPKSQLVKDLPYIQEWQGFDDLPEDWTKTQETDKNWVQERVPAFKQLLRERTERHIAVVGHGSFFEELIGRHMANCEVAELPSAVYDAPS
eukprot:TRINITY_DN49491_c0_g1_i1.p1 TRINITY_DN49491_c0_g1~~TRINITY_DN49491_c0_g1_i1.p1  ORF type:complete len:223 (+),score=24.89 TRINITY_DN49491_c0_g1_i1:3-671(+)